MSKVILSSLSIPQIVLDDVKATLFASDTSEGSIVEQLSCVFDVSKLEVYIYLSLGQYTKQYINEFRAAKIKVTYLDYDYLLKILPPGRVVALEGEIGAGKSTLAAILVKHFRERLATRATAPHVTYTPEPDLDKVLRPFYSAMPRYAFAMEVYSFALRIGDLMRQRGDQSKIRIFERSPRGATAFAQVTSMFFSDIQKKVYASLIGALEHLARDEIAKMTHVYLKPTLEQCQARLSARERAVEKGTVSKEYQAALRAINTRVFAEYETIEGRLVDAHPAKDPQSVLEIANIVIESLAHIATARAAESKTRKAPIVLTIDGILGAGKTSLIAAVEKALSAKFRVAVGGEDLMALTPALAEFNKDQKRGTFLLEIAVFASRLQTMLTVAEKDADVIILDRDYISDRIFTDMRKGNLDSVEAEVYAALDKLWNYLPEWIRSPRRAYIRPLVSTCQARLRHRARDCESKISVEYQTALQAAHDKWYGGVAGGTGAKRQGVVIFSGPLVEGDFRTPKSPIVELIAAMIGL